MLIKMLFDITHGIGCLKNGKFSVESRSNVKNRYVFFSEQIFVEAMKRNQLVRPEKNTRHFRCWAKFLISLFRLFKLIPFELLPADVFNLILIQIKVIAIAGARNMCRVSSFAHFTMNENTQNCVNLIELEQIKRHERREK